MRVELQKSLPAAAAADGRGKRMMPDAGTATMVVVGALVIFFVTYPLIWLFGSPSFEAGRIKLDYVYTVLTNARTGQAILNSLISSIATMVLSVLVGVPMALLVVRTDMPGRGLLRMLTVASFITPSFLLAFAYVFLLGPNAGLINEALANAFGFERGPFDIYTMSGFIFIATLEGVPLVFMATVAALEHMDGNLENAGRMLGARPWKIITTITLPLATPAILGGALLAFISTLSLYGAPAILNVRVVPTEIRAAFSAYPPRLDAAAGLSIYLLGLSLIGFFAYRKIVKGGSEYVTVTGKWAPAERMRLGYWKIPCFLLYALFALFAIGLPYTILGIASITEAVGMGLTPANLTFDNYLYVVSDSFSRRSLFNSLVLGIGAAVLGVMVGLVVAYIEVRRKDLFMRRWIEYAAMIPYGIPSVVLAVGLILAFIQPPVVLYGTMWILLLGYTIKFMPVAVRTIAANLQQIDPALEEASRMAGGTQFRTFTRVTLPLVLPGALASAFLIFIPSFRELGASILLSGPGTEVVAFAMMTSWGAVSFEVVCTLGVITLLITIGLFVLLQRFVLNRYKY